MRKWGNRRIVGVEADQFWLLLLAVWVVLIYGHSLTPATLSTEESGWVMTLLIKILNFFGNEGKWLTEHIVRKGAHFFEYCVLGILLIQNFRCTWQSSSWNVGRLRRSNLEKAIPLVLCVLAIPFLDETLQLFAAGRAAQVTDVWLDISGTVCGIALREAAVFLGGYFRRLYRPRRRRSRW